MDKKSIATNLHENMTLAEIMNGKVQALAGYGGKSFYDKAHTVTTPDGVEVLFSYGSPVIRKDAAGNMVRNLRTDDYSATTGRHIAAYAGLNKKEFFALPYEARNYNRLSY